MIAGFTDISTSKVKWFRGLTGGNIRSVFDLSNDFFQKKEFFMKFRMTSLALGGRKDLFANRNGEYGENGEYGGRARQELHLDRKSE